MAAQTMLSNDAFAVLSEKLITRTGGGPIGAASVRWPCSAHRSGFGLWGL